MILSLQFHQAADATRPGEAWERRAFVVTVEHKQSDVVLQGEVGKL